MNEPRTLIETKKYVVGEWKSLSVELRPTEDRTGGGVVAPTFLRRHFNFIEGEKFVGVITMYADNYGKTPLMSFEFKGKLNWGDAHPIAEGAWNIDYILSEGFSVTPLHEQAVAMLNQVRPENIAPFELNKTSDILKMSFPLFNIEAGQIVSDYDLIYFKHGLLFMGAKHVDGTPFDKPERRPNQLQIPLERIAK